MSDLLVPVIAGVVAAIVALIAHHMWMQRDALPARPDTRAGRGAARVPPLPAPEDTRRAFPVPDDERRALPVLRVAATPDASAAPTPLRSGRLRPVMSTTVEAVVEKRALTEPLRQPPTAGLPVAGAAITPDAPERGRKRRRLDDTPQAPARPARAGPQARRGRSTIQLDPLDAPTDPHNARIAVGGLIDDLETGRLGRGR